MSALSAGNAALIEELLHTWRSISEMAHVLSAEQWALPTDLPGWSVRDVVAHMASIEAHLLGRDESEHSVNEAAHVKNLLGAWNEQRVDRRRAWPLDSVLDEFDEVTRERAPVLRALDDERLATVEETPLGEMPLQRFVQTRLLDSWVHEQDIRRAVGFPETVGTDAASRVLGIALSWLPRAVAKAGVAEGGAVVVELLPRDGSAAALVQGGRGLACDARTPAVLHISATRGPFLRVALGRRAAQAAIEARDILVQGDSSLAVRVLTELNRMP